MSLTHHSKGIQVPNLYIDPGDWQILTPDSEIVIFKFHVLNLSLDVSSDSCFGGECRYKDTLFM